MFNYKIKKWDYWLFYYDDTYSFWTDVIIIWLNKKVIENNHLTNKYTLLKDIEYNWIYIHYENQVFHIYVLLDLNNRYYGERDWTEWKEFCFTINGKFNKNWISLKKLEKKEKEIKESKEYLELSELEKEIFDYKFDLLKKASLYSSIGESYNSIRIQERLIKIKKNKRNNEKL